jgi:hypothetical protein
MEYLIRRRGASPQNWGSIEHFHAASSNHRPQARFLVEYEDAGLYVSFRVSDRYVICRNTEPQSPVCKDSCVEAFLQPKPDAGYLNFEVNCGGTMLLYYVTDATKFRTPVKGFKPVAAELLAKVRIEHSMPRQILDEIGTPVEWSVDYFVPNEVFEAHVGALGPPGVRMWRGNFFKCADSSSHPHWGSWSPIGQALNFHVPEYFAPIHFE